jgi:hypothetical protein
MGKAYPNDALTEVLKEFTKPPQANADTLKVGH